MVWYRWVIIGRVIVIGVMVVLVIWLKREDNNWFIRVNFV